jgi:hypothetical protein
MNVNQQRFYLNISFNTNIYKLNGFTSTDLKIVN